MNTGSTVFQGGSLDLLSDAVNIHVHPIIVDNVDASKADKESVKRFISLCVVLKNMGDDEALMEKIIKPLKEL